MDLLRTITEEQCNHRGPYMYDVHPRWVGRRGVPKNRQSLDKVKEVA